MKINLITQKEFEDIKNIYEKFPRLTLQNKGYEGINRAKLNEDEKNADKNVNEILKKSIIDFSSFQNFRLTKDNQIQIRMQYDYTAHDRSAGIPFTGVGYILLDELLNGFKVMESN
jgi:hypothetical protein